MNWTENIKWHCPVKNNLSIANRQGTANNLRDSCAVNTVTNMREAKSALWSQTMANPHFLMCGTDEFHEQPQLLLLAAAPVTVDWFDNCTCLGKTAMCQGLLLAAGASVDSGFRKCPSASADFWCYTEGKSSTYLRLTN